MPGEKQRFFKHGVENARNRKKSHKLAIPIQKNRDIPDLIETPIYVIANATGGGNKELATEFAYQQCRQFERPLGNIKYFNASTKEVLRENLISFCVDTLHIDKGSVNTLSVKELSQKIAQQLEEDAKLIAEFSRNVSNNESIEETNKKLIARSMISEYDLRGGSKEFLERTIETLQKRNSRYIFIIENAHTVEDVEELLPLLGRTGGPANGDWYIPFGTPAPKYRNMLVLTTQNKELSPALQTRYPNDERQSKIVEVCDAGELQFDMVCDDLDKRELLSAGNSPIDICDILLGNARLYKKSFQRERVAELDPRTCSAVENIVEEIIGYFVNSDVKNLKYAGLYLKLLKTLRTYIDLYNELEGVNTLDVDYTWIQKIDQLHAAVEGRVLMPAEKDQELEGLYISCEMHLKTPEEITAYRKQQISKLEESLKNTSDESLRKMAEKRLTDLRARHEHYLKTGEIFPTWYTLLLSYKSAVDELLAFGEVEPAPITDPDAIARALNLIRAIKVEIDVTPSKPHVTFIYRMRELLTEIEKYHPNEEVKQAAKAAAEGKKRFRLKNPEAEAVRREAIRADIIATLTDDKLHNKENVLPMTDITQSLSKKILLITDTVQDLDNPIKEVWKDKKTKAINAAASAGHTVALENKDVSQNATTLENVASSSDTTVRQAKEKENIKIAGAAVNSVKQDLYRRVYKKQQAEEAMGWMYRIANFCTAGLWNWIYTYFSPTPQRVNARTESVAVAQGVSQWHHRDLKLSREGTGAPELVTRISEDNKEATEKASMQTMESGIIESTVITPTRDDKDPVINKHGQLKKVVITEGSEACVPEGDRIPIQTNMQVCLYPTRVQAEIAARRAHKVENVRKTSGDPEAIPGVNYPKREVAVLKT